jgi:hypothetical protein
MISAVELIYRDICKPQPAKPKVEVVQPEKPGCTRADVDRILAFELSATPEELQSILDRAKEFELSTWQRDKIALQMTIAMAAKLRQSQGVREDSTSLLFRSMGILQTPAGLLYGAERFAAELKAGAKAIMACRNHRPPLCRCWLASRDWLYAVRETYGQRSPESYAALKVWNALEEIELAGRANRSGVTMEDVTVPSAALMFSQTR